MQQEDLQAIEKMLDRKFKENNQVLKTEIFEGVNKRFDVVDKRFDVVDKKFGSIDKRFEEVISAVNDGFTGMQGQINNLENRFDNLENRFDELTEEVKKRPTREEMFDWADERFVDLENAKDRHDFIHIKELDKLPSQIEIRKALIERGFKHKASLKAN